MKKIRSLVTLIACFPVMTQAADIDPLSIGGLPRLIGDKLKEAKAAGLISFDGNAQGALYLPIWTFHDSASVDYVELGAGGASGGDGRGEFYIAPGFNLPAFSGRLWGSEWSQKHVRRSVFPPVWIGPYLKLPFPGQKWIFKEKAGIMLSVRFGN